MVFNVRIIGRPEYKEYDIMTISEFITSNEVDFTFNRITEKEIPQYEATLGAKIGPQLKGYIIDYGYLGYEYIEFYGINSIQGEGSDMVKKTLFLHQQFPKTQGMIAFEDQGDGDYYLVDSTDRVYRFIYSYDELVDTGLSLHEYILTRFESVKL